MRRLLLAGALAVGMVGVIGTAASPAAADTVCGYGHVGDVEVPLTHCGTGCVGFRVGPVSAEPYAALFVCVNV